MHDNDPIISLNNNKKKEEFFLSTIIERQEQWAEIDVRARASFSSVKNIPIEF